MKRFISVLLAALLIASILPLSALAQPRTLGKAVDGEVQFWFDISAHVEPWLGTDSEYYSDSFFAGSACEYNHALATFSAAAAMNGTSTSYEGGNRETAITKFLNNIGCEPDSICLHRYDTKATLDDVCAVAFAVKSLPGTDKYLVPVIVRGTSYSGEWVSNARFYDEDYADYTVGFRRSAEYAADLLEDYIADLKSEYGIERSELKLWICGYSRGAAVANDLGQIMTEAGGIGAENIYGYTFATPATVRSSAAGSYDNLFSICSEMDIVPRVPLEQWGFTRFGATLYLPCLSKTGSAYYGRVAAMQTEFNSLMAANGIGQYKNEPIPYQEKAIDICTSLLADAIASPEAYASEGWQTVLEGVMRDHSHQNLDGETLATILLGGLLPGGALVPAITDFLQNAAERTPEQNLAALNKLLLKIDLQRAGVTSKRDAKLLSALYSLVNDYITCLKYEKITGGNSQSTIYYHTLVALLCTLAIDGSASPIGVQHWAESYLAWMRSGTAQELLTTVPHSSADVRRPVLTGDVNGDGALTAADARTLTAYLLAPHRVSVDKAAADVDGNGRINATDLTKLNRLLSVQRSAAQRTSYLDKLI